MTTKVPDPEITSLVLNPYFSETLVGGWAEEDEANNILIRNPDGSLYAHLSSDVWLSLMANETTTEKEKEESK